jgi:hypothetical protein
LIALVRSTFGQSPEDMTYKHFAKLANEAVYLKQLDFKLMKNAVKSAISEILA